MYKRQAYSDSSSFVNLRIKTRLGFTVAPAAINTSCGIAVSYTHLFLEMMARTLGLSLEEMSTMGLEWKDNIVISSMGTVFAEAEVCLLYTSDNS